jgi:Rod binding domain-containing protein
MAQVTTQANIRAYEAAARAPQGSLAQKARATAQGFESTFLQNMLESMMAGLGEEGPLGTGQSGGGAWRGFMLEEMSKGMAKSGTLGIAPEVFSEIIRLQSRATTGT